jgi:hypothetical protein
MKAPLFAAALLLALNSAAVAGEFQFAPDGFAISLPAKPAYSAAQQQAAGKTVEQHTYASDLGGGVSLVVIAAAVGGTVADEAGLAAKNATATATALKGTITSQRPVMLGAHKGLQADVATPGNNVRCRFFFVNGTAYTLIAVVPAGAAFPASVDTAMQSFRLLP